MTLKGLITFYLNQYDLTELCCQLHIRSSLQLLLVPSMQQNGFLLTKLTELCSKIKGPVVLLGGPEDKERAEEITQAAGDSCI
jgi:hypothetical protein